MSKIDIVTVEQEKKFDNFRSGELFVARFSSGKDRVVWYDSWKGVVYYISPDGEVLYYSTLVDAAATLSNLRPIRSIGVEV